MIISASRRTDIPSYYSEWFFNRIKEKHVLIRNPMNFRQVSRVDLSPEVVDCIVFWTKNPQPMIDKLDQLKNYHFYFQFTLNSYGKDIECNIPSKGSEIVETFKKLSDKIGSEKVIWRYDPILMTEKYSLDYHIENFEKLARKLKDSTEKCVISFLDPYSKKTSNYIKNGIRKPTQDEQLVLAANIARIAKVYNISVESCAESIDLKAYGISHGRCIDRKLISRIIGDSINIEKDKNQRLECGCVSSIDIGTYNTCQNDCQYCYANTSAKFLVSNLNQYDIHSPILCSTINLEDHVSIRKVETLKDKQLKFY